MTEHTIEILIAAISAVVAGVGGWFAAVRRTASAAQTQQAEFYKQVLEECQRLRDENTDMKLQVGALFNEINGLKERLEQYESNPVLVETRKLVSEMFDADPNPKWIHVVGRNQWYLNRAYCELFGVNRIDFWSPINIIGQYNQDDALRYLKNDLDIIQTGATVEIGERVRTRVLDPACETYINGTFRKTPVTVGEQPYIIGEMIN